MRRTMTGFFAALAFLTRLPAPRLAAGDAGGIARAAPWLPVVGALIGAIVALVASAVSGLGPWIGALAGLLAWVLVTGALHLDGLGDVADGLGAAHGDPDRFVAVARDPHLGSFGAIAIVLQLVAKLILLQAVIERASVYELTAALALVGAWARWTPLAVGLAVPPLTEGLGSRFSAGLDWRVVAAEAIALSALSVAVAPALLAAMPLAAVMAFYWRRRLGGITGDGHGAGIEIVESVLLCALLLI
jgi:adenosylcobinamide-GDP ribazoletransferase